MGLQRSIQMRMGYITQIHFDAVRGEFCERPVSPVAAQFAAMPDSTTPAAQQSRSSGETGVVR